MHVSYAYFFNTFNSYNSKQYTLPLQLNQILLKNNDGTKDGSMFPNRFCSVICITESLWERPKIEE